MSNKKVFQILSKLSLLIVVIGFFQPIFCNLNGFRFARYLLDLQELIGEKIFTFTVINLYIVFITAILALLSMFIRICVEKELYSEKSFVIDVVLILLGIISGLKVFKFCNDNDLIINYFKYINSYFPIEEIPNNYFPQSGVYCILTGWILSLIFLLLGKEENFYKRAAREAVLEATKDIPTFVLENVKKSISIKELFTDTSACCYYIFAFLFILGGFFTYL